VKIDHTPYRYIRWVKAADFNPQTFRITTDTLIATDQLDNPVLLFQNEWSIRTVLERNNGVELTDIISR
jgi:peptide chain release factor 3